MRHAPGRPASPPQIDIEIRSPQWDKQPLAKKAVRNAILAAVSRTLNSGGRSEYCPHRRSDDSVA